MSKASTTSSRSSSTKSVETSQEIVPVASSSSSSTDSTSYFRFINLLRLNLAEEFAKFITRPIPTPGNFTTYFQNERNRLKAEEEKLRAHEPKTDLAVFDRVQTRMEDPAGENYDMEVDDEETQREQLIAARKQPIPEGEIQRFQAILSGPGTHEVVIEKFNIDMTRNKLHCLRRATWLNDEVINFYMNLLQERNTTRCAATSGKLTSHYFNSFFLSKLTEGNKYTYSNVKRWTKKFDITQKEKIFIPVNLSNTHWTMMIIFMQQKKICYYDSMSGSGMRHMRHVLQWIKDDIQDKRKEVIDTNEWKLIDVANVPQQCNGYDCGMFSIFCADYVSDDLPLLYSQEDMVMNRLKVGAAILRGHLTY